MSRMIKHCIVLGIVSFTLTGCVSQAKYQALKLERDQLASQLGQAQTDLSAALRETDAYKKQIEQMLGGDNTGRALVSNLMQQNSDLQKQVAELMAKLEGAMHGGGVEGPLPQELNDALRAFAAANPDIVDFDSARGTVKFKSDVTFALGEATLTDKAKEVIARFATILNSPAASGYELMVAGHTDSTRVSRPETIAKGHKDNWYLSAHRAISVAGALIGDQVNPQRLGVVGYADQRPVASNGSAAGRAQNRRVEVHILPTTIKGGMMHKGGSGTAHPKAELNKDTPVVAPQAAPVMNK